jgi:membrane-bound serine protease (ClpP class)
MKRTFLLMLFLLGASAAAHADVVELVVDDMIHPISDEYIGRGIAHAQEQHSDAILIRLRTPGGLEESMRSIVQKILRSPVPVIVYISPSGSRAASAGFFILESADIAAMAPGTNTGAAHPVLAGGARLDDVMKEKLENDAAAFMRSIARSRHRNVVVAESAVRQSKSFTEQEALSQNLIDLVAPDEPALLRAVNGRSIRRFDGTTAVIRIKNGHLDRYRMSLKERLLSTLMDPNVAFILFALGMLALWSELNHPGAVVPGVVGVISILLALFAFNLLPTRFAAVALLVVAFILFVLEAKFAAHGALGIGGVTAMVLGALFLVDGPIPQMRVHLLTALSVSVPLGVIVVFLMGLVMKARHTRITTGAEGMIGALGVVRTPLEPEGKVFVHGELWNARSNGALGAGTPVRVSSVDGLHLVVESAESPKP